MNFSKLAESIKTVRDFTSEAVKHTELVSLLAETKKVPGLVDRSLYDLRIIEDGRGLYDYLNGKAGYYGKMIAAPQYIAIFSGEAPGVWENSGFLLERFRLLAWNQGLGSCWISLDQPEDLSAWVDDPPAAPHVTGLLAVGFPDKGLKKQDTLKQSSRLPLTKLLFKDRWEESCPLDYLNTRGLTDAFHLTRYAPSWGNRQPWRFILHEERIYLAVDCQEEYRGRIDAGVVMYYFYAAAREIGFSQQWELLSKDSPYREKFRLPKSFCLVAFY